MYAKKSHIYVVFTTLFISAVTGCAGRPDAELTAANNALEAAIEAEARQYAAAEFTLAEQSLETAGQEIAAQDEAFALSRDYSRALELIAEAQTQAVTATSAAGINRERTMREVSAAIEETAAAIEATKLALLEAPAGKDSQADLAALQLDMDVLSAELEQARALFEEGQYLDARESLTETRTGVSNIGQQVQLARERVTGRRAL